MPRKAKYKGLGMQAEKWASMWKTGKIPRTIKAQAGDSWYRLAGRAYGDQTMVGNLYAANRGITNIHPGMKLRVGKPNIHKRARYRSPTPPSSRP